MPIASAYARSAGHILLDAIRNSPVRKRRLYDGEKPQNGHEGLPGIATAAPTLPSQVESACEVVVSLE